VEKQNEIIDRNTMKLKHETRETQMKIRDYDEKHKSQLQRIEERDEKTRADRELLLNRT